MTFSDLPVLSDCLALISFTSSPQKKLHFTLVFSHSHNLPEFSHSFTFSHFLPYSHSRSRFLLLTFCNPPSNNFSTQPNRTIEVKLHTYQPLQAKHFNPTRVRFLPSPPCPAALPYPPSLPTPILVPFSLLPPPCPFPPLTPSFRLPPP